MIGRYKMWLFEAIAVAVFICVVVFSICAVAAVLFVYAPTLLVVIVIVLAVFGGIFFVEGP